MIHIIIDQFVEGMKSGSAYYIGCIPYHRSDLKVLCPDLYDVLRKHIPSVFGGKGTKSPFIKQAIPLRMSDYDDDFIKNGLDNGSLLPLNSDKYFIVNNCAGNFVLFPTDYNKLNIEFDDNFMNIQYKNTVVKRANRETSYFNPNYDYRISYYTVGKYNVNGNWYSVYCEGIEMGVHSKAKNTMLYSPSYFCLYAIKQ